MKGLGGIFNESINFKIASTFCFQHRNLMKDTTEEILKTFFDHEDQLKRLYDEHIKFLVSSLFNTLCVAHGFPKSEIYRLLLISA